jgi:hypothetical protein
MKWKRILCVAMLLLLVAGLLLAQPRKSNARSAVETFFSLLRSQKYDALYDFLPSQFQGQTTREQLTQSLKRLDQYLLIEKLEIGRVQEHGDYAVVDTTIYGRLKKPMKLNESEIREGRVTVQQFLFRENGQWKLATADNRTQNFFLQRNPDFNKQFQITRPKFEFNQNGKWEGIRPQRVP